MNTPSKKLALSIVIPVYRSALILPQLVGRINKVLDDLGAEAEIVLVNDGSPDQSWEVIKALRVKCSRLRGINLMRNYGQHAALLAGINESSGAIIVTMDDDLQTPPEEMPKLLNELAKGFDLVYGIRKREQHGRVRNLLSIATKRLMNRLLGVGVATSISSYKAFRSELKHTFKGHTGPVVFIDAMLCWGTTNISKVVVEHQQRLAGISGYNFTRLVLHAISMATSFSQKPLQMASLIGMTATAFGVFLFAYVIFEYVFLGVPVRGFTFLAAVLTFFAGVQLFVLGVIGEYLAHMHQKLIGMPGYSVRDRTDRE